MVAAAVRANAPLPAPSFFLLYISPAPDNCRGGIHYSFFCILQEYVGMWVGKVRQEREYTTWCRC